jgi:hypothetical protein
MQIIVTVYLTGWFWYAEVLLSCRILVVAEEFFPFAAH